MQLLVAILLCWPSFTTAALVSSKSTITASSDLSCPSRTVNYITHGLPQQCLASSRSTPVSIFNHTAESSVPSTVTNSTEQGILTASSARETTSAVSTEVLERTERLSDIILQPVTASNNPTLAQPLATSVPQDLVQRDVDEEKSPLEDEKFLSFEEWKKLNLQKSGQSEHLGKDLTDLNHESRKRPVNVHNTLDAIGDDAELDFDFRGFVPEVSDLASSGVSEVKSEASTEESTTEQANAPRVRPRSKDAGTTYKERFNYASFDCAANVLKTNAEAKSASSVLVENKDAYMLNECSAKNKYLILELCNDISIDTIVLANFEFFSSIFRTFRVSVSDRYPVKTDKWKTLGTFEARNSRDVQAFLIENPVIWARYLRIDFLTHYGSEYYCPVSLVRVHGTTMLEEYKHDLESLQSEDDEDTESLVNSALGEDMVVPEAIAESILKEEAGKREAAAAKNQTEHQLSNATGSTTVPLRNDTAISIVSNDSLITRSVTNETQGGQFDPVGLRLSETCNMDEHEETTTSTSSASNGSSELVQNSNPSNQTSETMSDSTIQESSLGQGAKSQSPLINSSDLHSTLVNSSTIVATANATRTSGNVTSSERTKSASNTASAASAMPTMQESFFKSVQKRLQMLESNSSLSLQYIEDQSRALRDAFNKVEQRQLAKTTVFLEFLNTTVLNELRDFRQQYDQLWQSTVIELELQRERYQQETLAMNARLGVLADEVIFQKRVSILQMILIIVCLVLVIFSKGSLNEYLDIPLVQSVFARSPSTRWSSALNVESPTASPVGIRTRSVDRMEPSHGILKGHRRMQSEESLEGTLSTTDLYSPPTPVSFADPSDGEQSKEGDVLDDPNFDPSTIQRPSTSPPVLPSTEPSSVPGLNGLMDQDSLDTRLMASPENRDRHQPPRLVVEEATPTSKHLKWKLPEE